MSHESLYEFPADWTVGVGTSSWQIEGDSQGRGQTIWDTFAAEPGRVVDGTTADPACDHVNLMEGDADYIASLGVDMYRFSIAWARVQPGGTGPISAKGLDFYDRLCDRLLAAGVTPAVTLYHWDLPQALQDVGGWTNRSTAEAFADMASVVASRLSDRVGSWATLNEPWCAAFLGFAAGVHAPGLRDGGQALEVAYGLMRGHGLALSALRSERVKRAGIVLNLTPVLIEEHAADDPVVQAAAKQIDGLQNRIWLDILAGRGIPEDVVAATRDLTDWSFVLDTDMSAMSSTIDWLGINYYTPMRLDRAEGTAERAVGQDVSAFPGSPPVRFVPRPPTTTMGWEIEPDGLRQVLLQTSRALPQVPLWVSENGMACADTVTDGAVDDPDRIAYLRGHFDAARQAQAEGVRFEGYLVWSLFDNIEWAEGWTQRFGITYVDPATQQRIPKASALWLRDSLRARGKGV